jgi:hypothetical protein
MNSREFRRRLKTREIRLLKGIVLKRGGWGNAPKECAGKVTCIGQKETEGWLVLVSDPKEF